MKQSESAAREQWMEAVARELHRKIFGAGNEHEIQSCIAIIARHYVAREEWIPVSERLPEIENNLVLVVIAREDEQPLRDIGWLDDRGWHARSNKTQVTHWRPLPAAPLAAKGETE